MPVNPTGADLKRYLTEDPGGPVVMLNLLKVSSHEGYVAYIDALRGYADRVGAEIVYVGDTSSTLVAPEGFDWDVVLLVRYPSRQAFSRMVADPEYQQFTHLRTESVTNAVLQATIPWEEAR